MMDVLKKRPHLGEQRSKITVKIHVNHIRFFLNDFFLKNSYYSVYFEGHKGNKVKTHTLTKSLESLTAEEGLPIDGSITCSMTMFQDDIHRKYMNGHLKAKYKRMVVRQLTKLRSGEVLYRDVGFALLPLHRLIAAPDQFDTRLVLSHPVNVLDAYIDVTIDATVDGFMSSMPTSLSTPRKVLKNVQSGFNVLGLGTPVLKNTIISLDSQYFGVSPARPTYIDLNALGGPQGIDKFSCESIPVGETTPLSESNTSLFFNFMLNSPGSSKKANNKNNSSKNQTAQTSVINSSRGSSERVRLSDVIITDDDEDDEESDGVVMGEEHVVVVVGNDNKTKKSKVRGVHFTSEVEMVYFKEEEEECDQQEPTDDTTASLCEPHHEASSINPVDVVDEAPLTVSDLSIIVDDKQVN